MKVFFKIIGAIIAMVSCFCLWFTVPATAIFAVFNVLAAEMTVLGVIFSTLGFGIAWFISSLIAFFIGGVLTKATNE